MPWENNSPLTRLTCLTRSAISTLRSRQRRRRSSSSGVGAFTIAHTRGSPRLYASNARSRASPSILSVLARRRRRDVAIDDGSTTWLKAGARDGGVGGSVTSYEDRNSDRKDRLS